MVDSAQIYVKGPSALDLKMIPFGINCGITQTVVFTDEGGHKHNACLWRCAETAISKKLLQVEGWLYDEEHARIFSGVLCTSTGKAALTFT